MFTVVLFSILVIACLTGVVAFSVAALKARKVAPVTVPASRGAVANLAVLLLLGILAGLGLKWAEARRRRLEVRKVA